MIDVSRIALTISSPEVDDYQQVASNLAQALSTWGFAYLTNHGVDQNTVKNCFNQSRNFFKLPQHIKDNFARGIHQIQGYSRKGREILENENVMEAKESLDIQTCSGSLPDSTTPKLRPAVQHLSDEAKLLAQRLLRCLALDLKIDPQSFLKDHAGMLTGEGNASAIRLLHYPPLDKSSEYLEDDSSPEPPPQQQKITRCGKHTDYGGLTLLFQDNLGGLEVETLNSNEQQQWTRVSPIEGTIVVNIGDLLQFWSAGKYRATPHRVVVDRATSHQARFSMAVFIHPDHDTDISPLTSQLMIPMTNDEKSNKTARDHINRRFAETYLT